MDLKRSILCSLLRIIKYFPSKTNEYSSERLTEYVN